MRVLALAASLIAIIARGAAAEPIRVTVGGDYWLAFPSGSMTITNGGRSGSGRRIDLSDDLDLGVANLGEGSIAAEVGRHRFEISYQPLSFSGDTRPRTDLVFHGSTFPADERVRSDVELRLITPQYDYALLEDQTATLRVGLRAYVWTFDASLSGSTAEGGLSESRQFTHVLPALTSSAAIPLASWNLTSDGSFGTVGSNRYAVDLAAAISRKFGPLCSLAVGYRWFDFVFRETTNRGDLVVHGPFLSLTLDLSRI